MGHTTWLCSQDLTRFGHTTPKPHAHISSAETEFKWDEQVLNIYLSLNLQASGLYDDCKLNLQDADQFMEI